MIQVIDNTELVRRFNQDEALWRTYVAKRAARSLLGDRHWPAALLDHLDWVEAERECCRTDCIGRPLP